MATKESHNQAHPARPQAAYLIRCWREAEIWRFSVEDIASRQRWRYDSVEALLEDLETRLLDMSAGEPEE